MGKRRGQSDSCPYWRNLAIVLVTVIVATAIPITGGAQQPDREPVSKLPAEVPQPVQKSLETEANSTERKLVDHLTGEGLRVDQRFFATVQRALDEQPGVHALDPPVPAMADPQPPSGATGDSGSSGIVADSHVDEWGTVRLADPVRDLTGDGEAEIVVREIDLDTGDTRVQVLRGSTGEPIWNQTWSNWQIPFVLVPDDTDPSNLTGTGAGDLLVLRFQFDGWSWSDVGPCFIVCAETGTFAVEWTWELEAYRGGNGTPLWAKAYAGEYRNSYGYGSAVLATAAAGTLEFRNLLTFPAFGPSNPDGSRDVLVNILDVTVPWGYGSAGTWPVYASGFGGIPLLETEYELREGGTGDVMTSGSLGPSGVIPRASFLGFADGDSTPDLLTNEAPGSVNYVCAFAYVIYGTGTCASGAQDVVLQLEAVSGADGDTIWSEKKLPPGAGIPNAWFVATVGDLDGDEVREAEITWAEAYDTSVELVDGGSGATLWTSQGVPPSGTAVGDVDGDGVGDLVQTDFYDWGPVSVHLLSGANGASLYQAEADPADLDQSVIVVPAVNFHSHTVRCDAGADGILDFPILGIEYDWAEGRYTTHAGLWNTSAGNFLGTSSADGLGWSVCTGDLDGTKGSDLVLFAATSDADTTTARTSAYAGDAIEESQELWNATHLFEDGAIYGLLPAAGDAVGGDRADVVESAISYGGDDPYYESGVWATSGGNGTRAWQFGDDPGLPPVPDLEVTDVANVTGIAEGDTVRFEATVENQGGGAADAFNVSFTLDGNTSLGPVAVEGLEAAGTTTVTSEPWNATEGDHLLEVVADADDAVNETNETNNELEVAFTVTEEGSVSCEDPGPDELGYVCDGTSLDFVDVSAEGTSIELGDDDVSEPVDLGFPFPFYRDIYTEVRISSNGFLAFEDAHSGCCSGQEIPDPGSPNTLVAGFWEDLNPWAGGDILVDNRSVDGEEAFIVQFEQVPHYYSDTPVTFQFQLFANGTIKGMYPDAPSDGGTHSAGIEDAEGETGLQFVFGDVSLSDVGVVYTPPDREPPGAPENLSADGKPDRVALDWSPPSNGSVTSYNVYRGLDCADLSVLDIVSDDQTSYVDGSVDPGTAYCYAVSASFFGEEGNLSDEAEATPLPPPDPAVEDVKVEKTKLRTDYTPGLVNPAASIDVEATVVNRGDTATEDNASFVVEAWACPSEADSGLLEFAKWFLYLDRCQRILVEHPPPLEVGETVVMEGTWDHQGSLGDHEVCAQITYDRPQAEGGNDIACEETFVVVGGTGAGGFNPWLT